jgi:2'-5' RNA ligase
MPRAFIAIQVAPLPPLLQLISELEQLGGPVKAVAAGNLHITLRFLGETDESSLPAVTQAIEQAASSRRAFDFQLAGVGAFPSVSRPSVVWVGARGDGPLLDLVSELNPGIDALGFGGDARPFVTHLTIARVKARPPQRLLQLLSLWRDAAIGRVRVSRIDLMKSQLTKSGPIYSVVQSVPLT